MIYIILAVYNNYILSLLKNYMDRTGYQLSY